MSPRGGMRIRLFKYIDDVRSSYWFLPGLLAILSILLSFLTIALDDILQTEVRETLGFLWGGGPEGTRGLLETVAGSMITVAGVTFSVTMVALSLASSQFGSRLLRNFMADTGNQIVLGTFISTFLYSLLVLRTVRTGDDEFVPYISVTIAILLSIASIGVLIYFIHHVTLIMQSSYVVAEVAKDLFRTIERVFTKSEGEASQREVEIDGKLQMPESFDEGCIQIISNNSGYIQAVDDKKLLELSHKHDLFFKIPYRPGHFIIENYPIMFLYPKERLDDKERKKIVRAFIIGRERTHAQDVEYAIEQLVELAVRALSTGINDPFTANTCIDWLGAALAKMSEMEFPSNMRLDENGIVRILYERPFTFEGLINASFNQIRQNSEGSLSVRIRLLEALTLIAAHTQQEENLLILDEHIEMIYQDAQQEELNPEDMDDLRQRYLKFKNRDFGN
jgi:uncharacterized membrane protein